MPRHKLQVSIQFIASGRIVKSTFARSGRKDDYRFAWKFFVDQTIGEY
jgi:hypothetical protein